MAEHDDNSITVQILIGIREDLAALRSDVQAVKEEVKEVRVEQTKTRQDLGRRIDQTNLQLKTSEARLATEISALRSTVTDSEPKLDRQGLEERVEQCERDIAELRSQR